MADAQADLAVAARQCAALGLVDAFGHLSRRIDDRRFAITPPKALGRIDDHDELTTVELDAPELPPDVPGETWIHWAIYRARPDVSAICRAQPRSSHPFSAVADRLEPIHGQGAWVSPIVPVHPSVELVRNRGAGEAVADTLGSNDAVILRGNGAVVVGAEPWESVCRMWLLERSCRFSLAAMAAGGPRTLTADERESWAAKRPELLRRLWAELTQG